MQANRGGHWPDDSASVNRQRCGAALTPVDHASYTSSQSDCSDRTSIISNAPDLADRLESALAHIDSAIAARNADKAVAEARHAALKAAASEAVAALDSLIGDG
ncbi:MAG: hypothetical protein H7267_09660 [Sandarakinorhabdus sp.]|nr:hypothetical protein [Sandarakinorhabdus sp.]